MRGPIDILHCDANNFYASVEACKDPTLKGKNIAVCGDPKKRHGIILAKSEGAKAMGVKTGETIREATSKCPDLLLLPPDFDSYKLYSKKLFEIYTSYTDRVEPFGLDECWLDVKGSHSLFGDSERIAEEIRRRAREELGLTLSVGVSFTKAFAKLGSDMKKPDAQTVIDRENYKTVAWDLPVEDILMVGRNATKYFHSIGILTIGDLAQAEEKLLQGKLGQMGKTLKEWANGVEADEVKLYYEHRRPESVGNGATAARDLHTTEECHAFITALSERVATRLRKHSMRACGINLTLKFNDLSIVGKQSKFAYPTASAGDLTDAAMRLLPTLWAQGRSMPIRAITVTAIYLFDHEDYVQTDFIGSESASDKNTRLEESIDLIRAKYGSRSIARGNLIKEIFDADEDYDEDTKPFRR